MEGVLPGNAKLFDTPGLLHPHQITTRLTREEQKLLQVGKELKPRTYRIKVRFCTTKLIVCVNCCFMFIAFLRFVLDYFQTLFHVCISCFNLIKHVYIYFFHLCFVVLVQCR